MWNCNEKTNYLNKGLPTAGMVVNIFRDGIPRKALRSVLWNHGFVGLSVSHRKSGELEGKSKGLA
jgi:hypothetical protein